MRTFVRISIPADICLSVEKFGDESDFVMIEKAKRLVADRTDFEGLQLVQLDREHDAIVYPNLERTDAEVLDYETVEGDPGL